MQRDWLLCVDQAKAGIEEFDLAGLTLELGFQGFAADEAFNRCYLGFHIRQLHRAQPHGAASSKTCADAKIDPTRR